MSSRITKTTIKFENRKPNAGREIFSKISLNIINLLEWIDITLSPKLSANILITFGNLFRLLAFQLTLSFKGDVNVSLLSYLILF